MSTATIPTPLAARFLDVWGDAYLADDLGTRLTCHEVDVLADMLAALGDPGAAATWIGAHAVDDDEGDAHHTLKGSPQ
ncbi:hypothetical protein NOGI109294_23865 [Nocardiopsis gilva]|nr:hypothetical protein [Nocardiopsis gilva]